VPNLTGFEIWRDSHLPHVLGRYPALGSSTISRRGPALRWRSRCTWPAWPWRRPGALAALRDLVFAGASGRSGFADPRHAGGPARRPGRVALDAAQGRSRGAVVRGRGSRGVRAVARHADPLQRTQGPHAERRVDISRPTSGRPPGRSARNGRFSARGPAISRTPTRPPRIALWRAPWVTPTTSGSRSGPRPGSRSARVFVAGVRLRQGSLAQTAYGGLPALSVWIGLAAGALLQCHFSDDEVLMAAVFLATLGYGPSPNRPTPRVRAWRLDPAGRAAQLDIRLWRRKALLRRPNRHSSHVATGSGWGPAWWSSSPVHRSLHGIHHAGAPAAGPGYCVLIPVGILLGPKRSPNLPAPPNPPGNRRAAFSAGPLCIDRTAGG